MGWIHWAETLDEVVRELTEGAAEHALYGRAGQYELYVPRNAHLPDRDVPIPVITVNLISRKGGLWGYKCMDETMNPYYYNVPLSWLARYPDPKLGLSSAWRAKVRELHRESQ